MKTSFKIEPFAFFVIFCMLSNSLAVEAQYFRGYLQTPQGSEDCNACVNNVIQSVNTLSNRGEAMGFNWGANYPTVEGAETESHWQGVQRMPIVPGTDLNVPYIAVSSSHQGQSEPYSRFAVVEMASRDRDNLRLRSNRLELGRLTVATPPNASDRIVNANIITTSYQHPGGMQAIGKYLLVGSDTKIDGSTTSTLITLWDMSIPLAPRLVWDKEVAGHNANSMGIIRMEDGRFFMLRALPDARELEFYVKSSSDITENDWTLWDWWHYSELRTELDNDVNWLYECSYFGVTKIIGYQNTNIVAECGTGRLYLIASHGRCPNHPFGAGDDFVDAYRLDVPTQKPSDPYRPGEGVIITKVAKRQLYPGEHGGGFNYQGDLQAAGGVHVSPDNKLYFYATEHGRNGPNNSVKMIEFAPEEPHSQVNKIEEAWVELYVTQNFDGRSLILDYIDRDLRDYNDFSHTEDFDNKALSLIYAIPIGYRLRLYDLNNQSGGFLDLNGTGRAERITDLSSVKLSNGAIASSKISSAIWNGGQSAEVWVDFSYNGSKQDGTFNSPYNSLIGGLAGVLPGGTVKTKTGSSSETMTITKSVTLQASNGTVVIGKR